MSVTVWSKKPCVQCGAVKRALDKGGVAYEEKNLPDHPEQLEAFMAAGHMQAPVVEAVGHETFSGFMPDNVAAIVAEYGTK
jgi:glutaredoxin-like protein NrdH